MRVLAVDCGFGVGEFVVMRILACWVCVAGDGWSGRFWGFLLFVGGLLFSQFPGYFGLTWGWYNITVWCWLFGVSGFACCGVAVGFGVWWIC